MRKTKRGERKGGEKMPEWEDCAKIHEGCGGLVRWVEAIKTPSVGYYGECLYCGEHLVVEEIIPLEDFSVEHITNIPIEERKKLRWNEDKSFKENQLDFRFKLKDKGEEK